MGSHGHLTAHSEQSPWQRDGHQTGQHLFKFRLGAGVGRAGEGQHDRGEWVRWVSGRADGRWGGATGEPRGREERSEQDGGMDGLGGLGYYDFSW